jgi:hypothetical protein
MHEMVHVVVSAFNVTLQASTPVVAALNQILTHSPDSVMTCSSSSDERNRIDC